MSRESACERIETGYRCHSVCSWCGLRYVNCPDVDGHRFAEFARACKEAEDRAERIRAEEERKAQTFWARLGRWWRS